MTRRLLLSYIGLAVVILVVLEIPLGVLALHHERGLSAQAAEREASGLAVFASEALERHQQGDLTTLVKRYHASTGGEVSVVDTAGRITAMSDTDADRDALTENRALVEAALDGRPANAFGTDEGIPFAFAAVPVSDGGLPGGAVLLGIPATATLDRVHDIWLALLAFAGGILVLTAVLGLLLARSLTRPLERLESTVYAFAEGDLSARASRRGPAEMKDLADQFNRMAGRLRDLLQAQTRFVADASHQLRSPLTALRLRLENLEVAAGEPQAAGIAAAGQEVQRLSRIVDGLLTLGRAEGRAPERRAVDVRSVVEERCQSWSALADERRIGLDSSIPADHAGYGWLVPGDLDQMLDNLIANALDALDAGGRIEVRLEPPSGRDMVLHVTDNGPGMSAEERERAFDRFWQAPGSKGGHSGLGLAIVQQLAARNDAGIELLPADPRGLDAVITMRRSDGAAHARDPHGQENLKERQKLSS